MSSEQEQARLLAERIARRVSQGSAESRPSRAENGTDVGQELSVMRASLEELQKRLARIESHVTRGGGDATAQRERSVESREQGSVRSQSRPTATPAVTTHSPWLSGMYVPATSHPSQERFGVEEAAVSELVDFFEGEKKCELEPGGKPCDHCSMCSTRGF
jgi:hypothetical protein